MKEKKEVGEPSGLERFAHLEDKLYRVVEAFKAIRKENDSLRGENARLKGEIESLKRLEATHDGTLSSMQQERVELRERVEKALNLLTSLEIR